MSIYVPTAVLAFVAGIIRAAYKLRHADDDKR